MSKHPLYVFYEEPEFDRWIKYDRYPRRIIRRMVRGKRDIGGMELSFLNLLRGFDKMGVETRRNDFSAVKRNPELISLVFGKQHIIEKFSDKTPIVYGPGGIPDHPMVVDYWNKKNFKMLIAQSDWLAEMYVRDLKVQIPVEVAPIGIDTDYWQELNKKGKKKVLIYDKIRWKRDHYEPTLLHPIQEKLKSLGIEYEYIRYGKYKEEDFHNLLSEVSAMIFLCEHETQGFAYLQTLATNTPIFAWDRGGAWKDPNYYPDKVVFETVSSVPYWDERCGMKFRDANEFSSNIQTFMDKCNTNTFQPRNYVMEDLTLEKGARHYYNLVSKYLQ